MEPRLIPPVPDYFSSMNPQNTLSEFGLSFLAPHRNQTLRVANVECLHRLHYRQVSVPGFNDPKQFGGSISGDVDVPAGKRWLVYSSHAVLDHTFAKHRMVIKDSNADRIAHHRCFLDIRIVHHGFLVGSTAHKPQPGRPEERHPSPS